MLAEKHVIRCILQSGFLMITQHHLLTSQASGTQRQLVSWHFGNCDASPKVVIQSSLHADELPGMLVTLHLRRLLEEQEQAGKIKGQVVLIPVANPIGLDQTLLHSQLGRFELATGQNFNRNYPDVASWLLEPDVGLWQQLTPDSVANTSIVRQAMRQALLRHSPVTELDCMRHTLMQLALDADVVLDLHCDFEAAVHIYTEPPCVERLLPLASRLGACAMLVAEGSGGQCFDEAMSGVWWQLARQFRLQHGEKADQRPISQACVSATVELRGQADVSHTTALADAKALAHFLMDLSVLQGSPPAPIAASITPTPLSGSHIIKAPHPGVMAFHCEPGTPLRAGDAVVDVWEPLSGQCTTLHAEADGVLYARHIVRWATTGLEIAKISGVKPVRSGLLLGA